VNVDEQLANRAAHSYPPSLLIAPSRFAPLSELQ
jgi:hypothetical protein